MIKLEKGRKIVFRDGFMVKFKMKTSSWLKPASFAMLGLAAAASSYYVTRSTPASAENSGGDKVVMTKKERDAATELMAFNLQMGMEAFERIGELMKSEEKADQQTLDDLTYYMARYAALPQFVSLDDESGVQLADDGFMKLKALYEKAEIEPSFEISEDGEVKLTRDLHKPAEWAADEKEAKKVAKKIPEAIKEANKGEVIVAEDGDVFIEEGGDR